jgi:hypothetical protein
MDGIGYLKVAGRSSSIDWCRWLRIQQCHSIFIVRDEHILSPETTPVFWRPRIDF